MKNLIYLCMLLFVAASCQQPAPKETVEAPVVPVYEAPKHHSPALTAVFDAHGGYEQWSKMQSLSYQKGDEYTITNLWNRQIRVESPKQTIGFDGTEVWVTPDTVDASRARFYHNLYFYFYAMPFVVGDPGAYYEDMEPMELDGKIYNGIKVSYSAGIGDAPDDNYIIWANPETNKMEWLMYTVTYKGDGPSEKYSLIKYGNWAEVNGLLLPTSMQWFQYDGTTVGEARRDATPFTEVKITDQAPQADLFVMPENAQVAPK
ncbi:MAG: hypothetical protein HRT61_14630 [Ekhidna sp.]|nr:hypothetical protein [Ekhidna sp.]